MNAIVTLVHRAALLLVAGCLQVWEQPGWQRVAGVLMLVGMGGLIFFRSLVVAFGIVDLFRTNIRFEQTEADFIRNQRWERFQWCLIGLGLSGCLLHVLLPS